MAVGAPDVPVMAPATPEASSNPSSTNGKRKLQELESSDGISFAAAPSSTAGGSSDVVSVEDAQKCGDPVPSKTLTSTPRSDTPVDVTKPAEATYDTEGTNKRAKRNTRGTTKALDNLDLEQNVKSSRRTSVASKPRNKGVAIASKPVANDKKTTHKQATPTPLAPSPPAPAPVSERVLAKTRDMLAFHEYDMKQPYRALEHDADNPSLVRIPELDFEGVIMTMHSHYELYDQVDCDAALEEAYGSVTNSFHDTVHGSVSNYPWITVDLEVSKSGAFEQRIQNKILHHGLAGVGLLELEIEMSARKHAAACGLRLNGDQYDPGMRPESKFRELQLRLDADPVTRSGLGRSY